MTVVGAADVDAASRAGILQVGPRDLVTPLARERAGELGVQIVVATPGAAAALAGDAGASAPPTAPVRGLTSPVPRAAAQHAATAQLGRTETPTRAHSEPDSRGAPSGALFRRGAPLHGGAGRRVMVVGAGHVGMITALRLADADVFGEIVLVDIDEGRARGIALDLTHTAALSGFATAVRGTGTVEDAGPCDYVVITAGRARTPGMSRSDLVSTNAAIVGDVAARVARTSPSAVIVVVTNPLDEMTHHAWRASGFPPQRVIGMAGVLDTARFQALLALAGAGRADRIAAVALGSHGDEMVLPLSQVTGTFDPVDVDGIVDRARASGAEVVGLLRSGSAFLAPGTSAARMVLAMAAGSGEVMPAAVLADGTYGIRDVYIGLPVRLGRGGVREIVELDLRPEELAALRDAGARIRERVGQLKQMIPPTNITALIPAAPRVGENS